MCKIRSVRLFMALAFVVFFLPAGALQAQEKTGPKPKGTGAHNEKVEQIIREEKAKGNIHLGGGVGEKELVIPTSGGNKESRRPDASFRNVKTGETEHHQVGQNNAKGEPVKREREALEDLRTRAPATDRNVQFSPYTPAPPPKKK